MRVVLAFILFVSVQWSFPQAVVDQQFTGFSKNESIIVSAGSFGGVANRIRSGFSSISNYISNKYRLVSLEIETIIEPDECGEGLGSITIVSD